MKKIKCHYIRGIELFVNPAWDPITTKKKIEDTAVVIHGEFLFRERLEDCQIIVSNKFINEFIKKHELILNVIEYQFVWTKNTKEVQKKLYGLEMEVEFLFYIKEHDGKTLTQDDLDADGVVDFVFRLIE